ncbi:hypothetical protein HDU96_001081 [Phlyctochytrium bullatum]|nr:hypothetical protein HDU96_001081 [Phlyctochytrium bullatum]
MATITDRGNSSSSSDDGSLPPLVRRYLSGDMEFWFYGPGAEVYDPDPIPSPDCAFVHEMDLPKSLSKSPLEYLGFKATDLVRLPSVIGDMKQLRRLGSITHSVRNVNYNCFDQPVNADVDWAEIRTFGLGISTQFLPGPASTQEVPAVTTTQRLVALESSQAKGVPVTTAIAITSAASILSALLFAVGLFTAWTYRKKWAKGSESFQVQDRADGADVVGHSEGVDLAAVDRSLPPGVNNHTEGALYAMPAADDNSFGGSTVDEKEVLELNSQAEAPALTQLLVIMPGGAATGSGSQSVSSHSHENVLSWSPVDVQRWMDSVGFRREVVEMFKAHNIDGPRLLGLTDNILEQEIGITSAALRASILSVRARFFLQPRLPAEAVAGGGPSATPRQPLNGREPDGEEITLSDNNGTGVMRTLLSPAVFINEGMDGQAGFRVVFYYPS